MKKHLFLIIFVIAIPLYANDGGVEVVGGTLHPVNIENVSMDYERLVITCKESYFEIEAYIELYNHDRRSIKPLLGFEFYQGMLSYWDNITLRNKISQYALLVNGKPQKFEYGVQETNDSIHTLVFQPELNTGKNTVYHKFQMPYGFGSSQGGVYYILKTSSRWKGGIIKNLEIFIRTEESTILLFEGRTLSTSVSSFDTIGESKLYNKNTIQISGNSWECEYYSLTPNGYLYKKIENFVPNADIRFQLLDFLGMEMYIIYDDPPYKWERENAYITIFDWKRYIEDPEFHRYRWGENWHPSEKMLEGLTAEQLRILRNTLYAIRGYIFNDKFLQDYFNRQYWYFPNPNTAMSDIILSGAERKILEYIIAEENKR
jgi:hypothetical protein